MPRRGGYGTGGMKESGKERLKQAIYESTRAPLTRSPFPDGEGLVGATLRVDFYKGRCPKVVFKSPVTSHQSLATSYSSLLSNFKGAPHGLTTLPLAFIAQ